MAAILPIGVVGIIMTGVSSWMLSNAGELLVV